MKNPFEYAAPPVYHDITRTFIAGTVEDQLDIVRSADAQKCREILAWPGTGATIRKATERRLRKLEKLAQ
jgi:hypothetical protein